MYRCNACGAEFEVASPAIPELDLDETCPDCGSDDILCGVDDDGEYDDYPEDFYEEDE